MKTKKKKGFTLTELIVVIVIIGVLAAVMIPSISAYITKAKNSKDETLVASLNKSYQNAKIMDDLEFYTAYDVDAFLKEVEMDNIEVANKNNLILFDADDEKFVLVKDIEKETKVNEFVYHISEYYSYKALKAEPISNKNSNAVLKPLTSKKLGDEEESSTYEFHRAFIISINGPEIAQVVSAVMNLPINSDISKLKSLLSKLDEKTYKLVMSSITKTMFVSDKEAYYFDSEFNKKVYNNISWSEEKKPNSQPNEQKLTRVVILPNVEEVNFDLINKLEKSTIFIPGTADKVDASVTVANGSTVIGNVENSTKKYEEVLDDLEITELTYIDSYVYNESQLYEVINAYKNFSPELIAKIKEKKPEWELKSEIIIMNNFSVNSLLEIPKEMVLFIPYDDNLTDISTYVTNEKVPESVNIGNESSYGLAKMVKSDGTDDDSLMNRQLTISSGATLDVYGTIVIGGITGYPNNGLCSHTSGYYGQIKNNGTIILNNESILDCYGYIIGDGEIKTVNGAKLYEPFIVGDYGGGSNTALLSAKGTWDPINDNGYTTPFSQYAIINIQCKLTIVYGAKLYGYSRIRFNSGGYYLDNTATIIGTDENSFINLYTGSSATLVYDQNGSLKKDDRSKMKNVGKMIIDIYGGAETGAIKLNVTVGISNINFSKTVSSSNFLLPVPYNFTINFMSGESSIRNQIALFPGSEVYVKEGAKLTIDSDATLFVFYKLANLYNNATYFSSTYYDSYPSETAKTPAKLIVNGTLKINGTFGGIIQSNGENANIVTSPKAVLNGTNQAKFGGLTDSYLAVVKFTGDPVVQNYELKAMLFYDGKLQELEQNMSYSIKKNDKNMVSTTLEYYKANSNFKLESTKTTEDVKNLEVVGEWEKSTATLYKVSFVSYCNGSKIDVNFNDEYVLLNETIKKNSGAIKVDSGPNSAYRFVALYEDSNFTKEWNPNKKITSNTEIYAKWEKLCLVKFESNGGTEIEYQILEIGEKVTKPIEPTKADYMTSITITKYTFKGWYSDNKLKNTYNFDKTVNSNITIYVGWDSKISRNN